MKLGSVLEMSGPRDMSSLAGRECPWPALAEAEGGKGHSSTGPGAWTQDGELDRACWQWGGLRMGPASGAAKLKRPPSPSAQQFGHLAATAIGLARSGLKARPPAAG